MSDNGNKVTMKDNNAKNNEQLNTLSLNHTSTQRQESQDGTSDSDEYLSEPFRYRNFQHSACSGNSDSTLVAQDSIAEENDNFINPNGAINFDNIQIPIVGYEIMEERARFTVYKLRIENKITGDCWYVFRRYTDFVRLCNRIRSHSHIVHHLPRKRWLKNNFDPIFLEERVSGLQTLVNAILAEPNLVKSQEIQDFFCLNEPPIYSDTSEESKAMLESLEETINDLRIQLREKEALIDSLQDSLHSKTLESDNLLKIIQSNTSLICQKCQKDCQKISKVLK